MFPPFLIFLFRTYPINLINLFPLILTFSRKGRREKTSPLILTFSRKGRREIIKRVSVYPPLP